MVTLKSSIQVHMVIVVLATMTTTKAADGTVVNVREYGAVGDGLTDDTAAIRDAISAGKGSENTVYFPPGTYKTKQLDIDNLENCHILGEDPDSTVLKMDFCDSNNVFIDADGWSFVVMKGIGLDGFHSGFLNDGQNKYAFHCNSGNHVTLIDCKAYDWEFGLFFYDDCNNCSLIGCEAYNCFYEGMGSFAHSTRKNYNIQVIDCYNHNNYIPGGGSGSIRFEETYRSSITGCISYGNMEGYRVENSNYNRIENNIASGNHGCGISIYNYSSYNQIVGNQCYYNTIDDCNVATTPANDGNADKSGAGIQLQYNCDYNVVMGNTCVGDLAYGIWINSRNFTEASGFASKSNIIIANVCHSNNAGQIEDRGYANIVVDYTNKGALSIILP